MYNMDFDLLVRWLLPSFLRKPRIVSFILALLQPVKEVHDQFLLKIEQTKLELSFNGQTMVLEVALNHFFPNLGNQIYIQNLDGQINNEYVFFESEGQPPRYAYFESEGQPPQYLYFETEYSSTLDFIVWVPSSLIFSREKMEVILDRYKVSGKRYDILTF